MHRRIVCGILDPSHDENILRLARGRRGRRSIGVILGLSTMVTVIGNIVGPLLAGMFADWQGNYRAGFTVLAVLAAVGSLFFLMAKPPPPPSHNGAAT